MPENKKKDLVAKIIDAEFEMFHSVPNVGGTAPCQEDRKTFEVHRVAQAMTWSEPQLESYLNDLIEAKRNSRNLMTEKYGRMMKSTSPEEYAQIEPMLPRLDSKILQVIEDIIKIEVQWQEQIMAKYPHVVKRGRPIHSSEDAPYVTSFETYLRGELSTYSLKTLKSYYENISNQKSQKINAAELALEQVVKSYNYKSAQEANEALKLKSP